MWEAHVGRPNSKRWRHCVFVVDEQASGATSSGRTAAALKLGEWLEQRGIPIKPLARRSKSSSSGPSATPSGATSTADTLDSTGAADHGDPPPPAPLLASTAETISRRDDCKGGDAGTGTGASGDSNGSREPEAHREARVAAPVETPAGADTSAEGGAMDWAPAPQNGDGTLKDSSAGAEVPAPPAPSFPLPVRRRPATFHFNSTSGGGSTEEAADEGRAEEQGRAQRGAADEKSGAGVTCPPCTRIAPTAPSPADGGGGPSTSLAPPPPTTQTVVKRRAAAGATAEPGKRTGKQLYVKATPYARQGVVRHGVPDKVPGSRRWSPAAWVAAEQLAERQRGRGALRAALSSDVPVRKDSAEPIEKLAVGERLKRLHEMEHELVTFGKSGIHGWGLMAKQAIEPGAMIVEYRGEVVRSIISELREHRYNLSKTDCFLFTLDTDKVCDSTFCGGIARFTNHCCNPNMYTRLLEADGEPHVVFCARKAIVVGEELTYDYRMESDDTTMPCHCNAPNCRGTIDVT
ncbi:hypothetical protein CYMTET_42350 [Cymbomonas tetramitiformis]|nr:hypothetical protein CYMTET_42350 [Cymbomonas tetramitiformis]